MTLADKILGVAKEGLAAYKTYLATRQEAYNRQKDKEQEKAIHAGEQYIFTNESEKAATDQKEKRRLQKKLSYWKARFFKYH